MSIRTRIVATITACLFIACASISLTAYTLARNTAIDSFVDLSSSELRRIEERIATFVEPGMMSVKYLSGLGLIRDSRGKLTSYLDTTEVTTLWYENHPPYEQAIYDVFMGVHDTNNYYGLVFMANDDGQYAQAPEGAIKNPGYDPRLRSWYADVMNSDKDVAISAPYLTTGGGMVCSIMTKTYDVYGRLLGMVGVDYSLESLTGDLTSRHILGTGYIIVYDNKGNIIVDGGEPGNVDMEPDDYPESRKLIAQSVEKSIKIVDESTETKYIVTHQMESTDWLIAVVFDYAEMMAPSYNLLTAIILISVAVFTIALIVAIIMSRGIVRPIESLTEASVIISSGAYEKSEELYKELKGKLDVKGVGESKALAESLSVMVETLQERIETAHAANHAKSAFLSTMSHEIRTPMNAILGITEILLQDDAHTQETKEALGKIYSSGDLLLGIINDILDLSKIEAGKLELLIERYEIASLVSDTAQLNMMRIGSKPIEFALYVDENMPANLTGDELRVKQILNNILSNAFKYTSKGTVKLSVSAAPPDGEAENVTLVFSISDTGQGMTKEQVDNLFDEYARFNTKANRTTEGTGLGMSITRNLIQLMNGQIFIESEPGKGSTFTVHLPQGRVDSEILGKEMAENLHNFRSNSRAQMKRVQITRDPMPYGSVLIVDDVETNIYVAKGLMTPYKLKIHSADSGFAAIEKIKNGNIYDVIFMDHMMPQMDGIEATQKIRDMGYNDPIIALTANAVAGQADIFLGNGFDDFISKPIDVRQLNTVLNKFIRDKQTPEVIEAAKNEISSDSEPQPSIDTHIAEIFARDAKKALATLEAIAEKNDYANEADLRTYIINVHGMKSALANIGKMDLSAAALKLETAGRERKLEIITYETAAFLTALRAYITELIPQNEPAIDAADEDTASLREKLLAIKAACEEYDESAANEILTQLRKAAWSPPTNDCLSAISEHLLHSDFDEVAGVIDEYMETGKEP